MLGFRQGFQKLMGKKKKRVKKITNLVVYSCVSSYLGRVEYCSGL